MRLLGDPQILFNLICYLLRVTGLQIRLLFDWPSAFTLRGFRPAAGFIPAEGFLFIEKLIYIADPFS
jgi:hypothetical protein